MMTPRIYQLCREAITLMALEDAPISKRVAKAYILFLIHVNIEDLPHEHQHHLAALNKAFEDEVTEKVGVTDLSPADANSLARHTVDLFTGVADHFHGNM
jgi:hypothetical protein